MADQLWNLSADLNDRHHDQPSTLTNVAKNSRISRQHALRGSIPIKQIERSDLDWISTHSDGRTFKAFGGSDNLKELLERFRSFSAEHGRFMHS